jgi:hypothetical protein
MRASVRGAALRIFRRADLARNDSIISCAGVRHPARNPSISRRSRLSICTKFHDRQEQVLARIAAAACVPVFALKSGPPRAPKLVHRFLLFGCPSFTNGLEFLYGDALIPLCVVSAGNCEEL